MDFVFVTALGSVPHLQTRFLYSDVIYTLCFDSKAYEPLLHSFDDVGRRLVDSMALTVHTSFVQPVTHTRSCDLSL
jgi:hypothetical protein